MSLDPSIDKSPEACQQLVNDVKEELARTFGAAWKTQFMEVPANMQTWIERDIPGMVVENFSNDDQIMLVDKSNEELKTLRVFDTALEKLDKVGMTDIDHQQMLLDTEPFASQSPLAQMLRDKATQKFPDYLEAAESPAGETRFGGDGPAHASGFVHRRHPRAGDDVAVAHRAIPARSREAVSRPRTFRE